jgi:hypothetical protein
MQKPISINNVLLGLKVRCVVLLKVSTVSSLAVAQSLEVEGRRYHCGGLRAILGIIAVVARLSKWGRLSFYLCCLEFAMA